jgi:hypothetical protein
MDACEAREHGSDSKRNHQMKGKYISEDETGGFNVAKVNLPLSEGRLRLYLGEERLVRGWTSCASEKMKEKDYMRRFFHGPRRRCTTKLCATNWRNPGAAELLR